MPQPTISLTINPADVVRTQSEHMGKLVDEVNSLERRIDEVSCALNEMSAATEPDCYVGLRVHMANTLATLRYQVVDAMKELEAATAEFNGTDETVCGTCNGSGVLSSMGGQVEHDCPDCRGGQ